MSQEVPAADSAIVRDQAMRWLVRREYGQRELSRRLCAKGFDPAEVDSVVQTLTEEGSQSDQRFVEEYIRARVKRGFGPDRIAAELGERGIDRDLIASRLDRDATEWEQQAVVVLRKRFPPAEPMTEPPAEPIPDSPADSLANYGADARERQRRERFLRYRGFSPAQVRRAMRD